MTNPELTNNKWYAIYTRPRFEKKIHNNLQKSGFRTFLPLIKEKRVWSDRIKIVEVPLLTSYVFIKTSKLEFPRVYLNPGFVRFVSSEGKPCEIKEEEILLLEKIITTGFQVQPVTHCKAGDFVRIVRGPLKGWEGRVKKTLGNSRVLFHLDCIQQTISVEVAACDIEEVR